MSATSSHDLTANDKDKIAEQAYQRRVARDLPRNFTAHLLHGLLGQTGFRLLNAPTFLPAYIMTLTGSEFVVGLCRAIQYLGMFLSPLIGANMIEHRRRVLPIGFTIGALMRLQIWGSQLQGSCLRRPELSLQSPCFCFSSVSCLVCRE